ncbi:MAG: hypothetical protein FWC89_09615 [Defluviitaleaceae bacterium]|nr:hypothetical protein [Defluviitaleaceae bacterium]
MKKMVFIGVIVLLVAFAGCSSADVATQDNLIRTIELPDTIERVAVRSAIGDSGGNGNHNTIRSVMLVRTDLTRDDLVDVFIDLDFRSPFNRDGNPNYPHVARIIQPNGYQFNSPREFRLDFEELKHLDTFDGYFFIEFTR